VSDGEERSSAPEHYFAERPRARSARRELRFLYRGELLHFVVDAGVFATHGLDPGTALLIESLAVGPRDRVLDLGCGWGPVGVAAGKAAPRGTVVLTEVNRRAARLAEENLVSNGISHGEVRIGPSFAPVEGERFDLIATNPPYRAGRQLVLDMLREAPAHLTEHGRLLVVGKGSQGIRFYQGWIQEHLGGELAVVGRGSGYRVLEWRPAPLEPKRLKTGVGSAAALAGKGLSSRGRPRSGPRSAGQNTPGE
jgi:16S rRNA (guanine1207-N2)-methyltransferase